MAHLLVIEDDLELSDELRDTLEDAGYQVQTAATGEQAVAWARMAPQLDLVLTDVRMAGIGGLAALEEIRKLRPLVRGVVMTGYASDEAPGRAVRAGAWDYLYKPFDQSELLQALQNVLQAEALREATGSRIAGLFEGARRWFKRTLKEDLEGLRERAYRAFHAGIRSRLLTRERALSAWDELERVEHLYLEKGEEASLEGEYRQVLQLIAGLQRESVQVVSWDDERAPHLVPQERFDGFFRRIYRGELPLHKLRTALPLRLLQPEQLVGNPGLREVVEEVWG